MGSRLFLQGPPGWRALVSGIGLALSGVAACEAWHRAMWGSLTGAGLVAAWIILLQVWRTGRGNVPAAAAELDAEAGEAGLHRLLLDAAPTPMLAIEGEAARALNRAARRLFATDDKVLPMPAALADGACGHWRHAGRNWRLDRVVLPAEGRTVVALIDIEQEENAAEARATAEMIQVLGHELLNGLAPIVSLADSGVAAIAGPAAAGPAAAGPSPDGPAPDTALLREILGTLARQAEGLQRFVEVYRILARLPPPQLRPVALDQLLEDLTRLFVGRWSQVAFCVDAAPGLCWPMDRDQISQALWALIQNAVEAALADRGEHARIGLAVSRSDRGLCLEVRDNGNGIAPQDAAHVFRAFHTTKADGTGIGLSLARQIAQVHGGTLSTYRSDLTVFRLLLPEPRGSSQFLA
ncbi:ATP-binding protein [Sphingomonas sp. IC081]|nr:ATP-binding protein [Sphingomonas sp. IC081]